MTSPIKKELILINPSNSYFLINCLEIAITHSPVPYALHILAALTPKEYKIKIINHKAFWRRQDYTAGALVGITCLTAAACEAYRLADAFRKAGSKVVVGGPHVSALPQEALLHADSVVIGEVESIWGQVLSDYENDRLEKIYRAKPLEDFFTPVYDYFLHMDPSELLRLGNHIDRGCKYHCDFCSKISGWLRTIKMEQVIELIKRASMGRHNIFFRRPTISFRCDNIYSNPAYAKELFKRMIPLKIYWGSNSSIDMAFDEEALRLAKASGCKQVFIGFESKNPEDYKKTSLEKLHSLKDYKTAIGNIRAHGIKITGSFIIGLDSYNHMDYLKLLWFLMRSGIWTFSFVILTPLPGSQLYERLKKENRIFSSNYRRYIPYLCVIKPKRMSVFAVYFWYWLIRLVLIFFEPQFYINTVAIYLILTAIDFIYTRSWDMGYYVAVHFIRGF